MIVVSCMGRLRHLQQTLPAMLAQDRVIVVDWSCPDGTAKWVRNRQRLGDHWARVVQVKGRRSFHKTAALNLGVHEAIDVTAHIDWRPIRNNWLLFLDADTKIADPERFCDWYEQAMRDRDHFHFCHRPPGHHENFDLTGVLLVTPEHFVAAGGYDEGIVGWGAEDIDLRFRLALRVGLPWRDIPHTLFSPIKHSDQLRVQNYVEKDLVKSNLHNLRRFRKNIPIYSGGKRLEQLDAKYRPLLSMIDS